MAIIRCLSSQRTKKKKDILWEVVVAQLVEAAFDTRGPRFDSSHWQNLIEHLFIINCIEKTKINKKEAGNGPLFLKKKMSIFYPSF